MYEYSAEVIENYDGDTVTLLIDQGLHSFQIEKCRLARINTPEVKGPERPEGLVARDYVNKLIGGKTVKIKTYKDKTGKYGRYIVEIFMEKGGENVNDHLVREGYAIYVNY
jgi:micrococcal nuclease